MPQAYVSLVVGHLTPNDVEAIWEPRGGHLPHHAVKEIMASLFSAAPTLPNVDNWDVDTSWEILETARLFLGPAMAYWVPAAGTMQERDTKEVALCALACMLALAIGRPAGGLYMTPDGYLLLLESADVLDEQGWAFLAFLRWLETFTQDGDIHRLATTLWLGRQFSTSARDLISDRLFVAGRVSLTFVEMSSGWATVAKKWLTADGALSTKIPELEEVLPHCGRRDE